MNLNPELNRPIDPALWQQAEIRLALARRDVAAIYGYLAKQGFSQRRIASLTGQAQSEVNAILRDGRQVLSYEVLCRIADGLGILRGYMGLGYDGDTSELLHVHSEDFGAGISELPTDLIAHAAQVTMGAVAFGAAHWYAPVAVERTPVRARIGVSEVEQIEFATQALRALDARTGGGSCRDAVIGHIGWAQQHLRRAHFREDVEQRLHVAIADLHNLAGWVSFDIGLYRSASSHYRRALEQARHADDASLVANILYRMGRLHLHLVDTVPAASRSVHARNALRLFQLGQIAAQDSRCGVTVAMLCANEATAYAVLGDATQVARSLGRADDELARAEPDTAAGWVRFFGHTDLDATTGVAHSALADSAPRQRRSALEALTRSTIARDSQAARSRAFELTALAAVHIADGDIDHGLALGHQAVDLATCIRSTRVSDRLLPLQRAAARTRTADASELIHRISTLSVA